MNKSFCVFVDEMYYGDFVALYNSWKYYEHKTPLKVYSHNNLSEEKKEKIKKNCELIEIKNPGIESRVYFGKQIFKYLAMIEYMNDVEILLDADTIFLSNCDFLFDIVESGKIIGACEFDSEFNAKAYYLNEFDFFYDKQIIKNHLGNEIANNFNISFLNKVFNGGLIGFKKENHKILLQKTIDILTDKEISDVNPIFHNEQFMVNFLIKLMNYETHELPRQNWMNTWVNHSNPKKIIKIDDGKISLYNEGGGKINFYHFTGGIGMPHRDSGLVYSCRPHQLYSNQPYEIQFNRQDVEKLWYEIHQNPILLIYEFFYNKGFNK